MAIVTQIYQDRATVTFQEKRHTYSIRVHGHVEKLWQPSVTGILGLKAKPALTNWAAKKSLEYVAKRLGEFQSFSGEKLPIPAHIVHNWLAEAADGWNEDATATTIGTVAHRYSYEELRFRAGLTPHRPKFPLEHDPVLMPDFTAGMVEAANSSVRAVVNFFDEHHFEPFLMERPLWSPIDGFVGTPDYIGLIDGELAIADYKTSKRIYAEYWAQLAALQYMFQMEFPDKVIKHRYAINIPKDGGDLQVEKRGLDTFSSDLDMFMACWALYRWERENDDWKKGTPVQVLGDLDLLIARPTETR
jgi:hypothetical protein